jgi:hypothetical protein
MSRLSQLVAGALAQVQLPDDVNLVVDIDPVNLF